jgi:hypothetical protein
MGYVKVVGHKDPTNFTAEVIFERDENGEPSVYARKGEPSELSAAQVKYLKEDGFIVEDSSKGEFDSFSGAREAGPAADVVGSAPVMSATSNPAPGAAARTPREGV